MNRQLQAQLIKQALANNQNFHMAAALIRKNKLIAIASNGRVSGRIYRIYRDNKIHRSYELHAEEAVALEAKAGDHIYVLRVRKDGTLGMARPCKYCLARMLRIGIYNIWYTNRLGEWERWIKNP